MGNVCFGGNMKLHIPLAASAAFVISTTLFAGPVVLTNNLSEPLQSVDALSTSYWHGISFTTDNNGYTLDTVTLFMELGGGTSSIADVGTLAVGDIPEVDLYSDSGGSPGSLLAVLAAIGTPSNSLQDVDFAGGGNTLAANSTYWIVLRALSGNVSWGYAATNNGSGIGFTDDIGSSNDSGATWFTEVGDYPDQAEVTADLIGTPEPSTLLLTGAAFLTLAISLRRRFV
jgi:hypothetical protein